MFENFDEIEFLPIITLVMQLNGIIFFTAFMIGFTIKKLIHIMKG